MFSATTTDVDPRFEAAMQIAFGSPTKQVEKEEELPMYRPQMHTPRRYSRCPHCYTVTRHYVEKVLEKGKGTLLECVWCWSLFNTKGNCR